MSLLSIYVFHAYPSLPFPSLSCLSTSIKIASTFFLIPSLLSLLYFRRPCSLPVSITALSSLPLLLVVVHILTPLLLSLRNFSLTDFPLYSIYLILIKMRLLSYHITIISFFYSPPYSLILIASHSLSIPLCDLPCRRKCVHERVPPPRLQHPHP